MVDSLHKIAPVLGWDTLDMKYVLVVCTANICRSPMAEGMLRSRLEREGLASKIGVYSAGTDARHGDHADPNIVALLAERGIAVGLHLSYPLQPKEIEEAEVILVMEEAHRRRMFSIASTQLPKVMLLSELAGRAGDIDDPYGRDLPAYRATCNQIERYLMLGWPRLMRMIAA